MERHCYRRATRARDLVAFKGQHKERERTRDAGQEQEQTEIGPFRVSRNLLGASRRKLRRINA
jgi:hypothetical protein